MAPRCDGFCYDFAVATNETEYQPRTLERLTRWVAFAGIALLVLRRLVRAAYPEAIPSSAWRPELWWAGLLISAVFELIVLVALLGVPVGIYLFKRRSGRPSARDLKLDCAAVVGLYLTALFLL